jgi:hypothetical protein
MEQLSSLRTLEDRGRRNRVRMDGQGLGKKQKARHRECSSTQVSVQSTDANLGTRLPTKKYTHFFRGHMKPQPGDISIVENMGTFLMWYNTVDPVTLTFWHISLSINNLV